MCVCTYKFVYHSVSVLQVPLWQGVKAQICKELHTVPDVCTALANVDVSISFLVSTPRHPDQNLEDFMVKTLKMREPLFSSQVTFRS